MFFHFHAHVRSLKEAEHHYVEAQEWHSAMAMYRSSEMWDDAIRVAKFYGGIVACKRVTIALLMAVGVVSKDSIPFCINI